MIIVCETKATEAQISAIQQKIREAGLEVHRSDGVDNTVLGVVGDRNRLDIGVFTLLPGVRDVVPVSTPYKLASREFRPEDTLVRVREMAIVGGTEVVVMAGPCAVETVEQRTAVESDPAGPEEAKQ